MAGLTLDAGALIGWERQSGVVRRALDRTVRADRPIRVPAVVLAQVWRDGARQARLAGLLSGEGVEVLRFDGLDARAVGEVLGRSRTTDVVDAAVVLCARRHGDVVLTSDPDDLRRLDPSLRLVVV